MDDLVAFLRARLDEDEAAARRNIGDSGLHDRDWSTLPGWPDYQTYSSDDLDAAGDYIDRFRPLRALRGVEAKRATLAAYIAARAAVPPVDDWYEVADGVKVGMADGLEIAVKHDAAVWSDHPDYCQEEWKP